jgi:isopropylmalate/homocitrate/citramalate synthase
MDTTLRDGEQRVLLQKTNHCAIVVEELNIDRIEIASHVSEGEFQGVKGIMANEKITQ